MSNIPLARTKLELILLNPLMPVRERRTILTEALKLMRRRRTKFKAPPECKKLSIQQKREARRLRKQGWSLLRIARRLNTNHGRVSEAIRGKAHP